MGCLMGLGAFVLFFLSDYNDWRLSRRELSGCFPAGGALLAAGTALEIRRGAPFVSGWLRWPLAGLAALFAALLIYTLFFAAGGCLIHPPGGKTPRLHHGGLCSLQASRRAVVYRTVHLPLAGAGAAALGGGGLQRIECAAGRV